MNIFRCLKHAAWRSAALLLLAGLLAGATAAFAQQRIYIADDDHTDLIWSGTEAQYTTALPQMLDYYLDLADQTATLAPDFQSRFNADGSFWLWTYARNRTAQQYQRLIGRIRDGHITIPLQPLVLCYGTMPAEAVLRCMYYAGRIERQEGLNFELVSAMENATHCYGIGSLWAGAGATCSWKGVCACKTTTTGLDNRGREIYWEVGPDGRKVLMKWHSLYDPTLPGGIVQNQSSGGYAEARDPAHAVDFASSDPTFLARYPFDQVVGLFGYGWDDLETMTDAFVTTAQSLSTPSRRVIVSNETDFFNDLQTSAPPGAIPSFSGGFGLEWDLASASLAEVSATMKRSVESLRTAEALQTLVELANPGALAGWTALRDSSLMYLGLYYEHDFADPYHLNTTDRGPFERRCAAAMQSYVGGLQQDALARLGALIQKPAGANRFLVLNPLGWRRTDFADLPTLPAAPYRVVDVATGAEVRSQTITTGGQQLVRILAAGVPPLGFKVYEIQPGTSAFADSAATFSGGGQTFENDKYRVTLTSSGAISSLIDKAHGGAQWVQSIGGRMMNDLGVGSGTVTAENVGPVSATLRVDAGGSPPHRTRVTLYRTIDRVDIDNEVTGNFGNNPLAYSFGVNLSGYTVHHEEVGAIATAKYLSEGGSYSPTQCRYDYLTMNHFVDLSDATHGLTLSNWDSQVFRLGFSSGSTIDETTPRVDAIVGGKLGGFGFDNQDGDTYFRDRYALRRHDVYDQAAAMRFALEHQNPLVAGPVTSSAAAPYQGTGFSLLAFADTSVVLWAAKPSEEGIGSGLILRVWNVDRVPHPANVTFAPGVTVQQVARTSHIETDVSGSTGVPKGGVALATGAGKFFDPLAPQWMQTYRVRLQVPLSVPDHGGPPPPRIERLGQNFPNPFNPSTTIAFDLAARERVSLNVYDLRGRLVARLLDGELDAGPHEVRFDTSTARLASGIYLYRLRTPEFTKARSMALLK